MSIHIEGLERKLEETVKCWRDGWVGLSWRDYVIGHTKRVRNLVKVIGKSEGLDRLDILQLEIAAALHDITKEFEGLQAKTDGQTVKDEDGLYLSEMVLPVRRNDVVDRYFELYLGAEQSPTAVLHSKSGAKIAKWILLRKGLSQNYASEVAYLIKNHILPYDGIDKDRLFVMRQILKDADIIDSSFGLNTFYRTALYRVRKQISEGKPTDDVYDLAVSFFEHMYEPTTNLDGSSKDCWVNRVGNSIETDIRTTTAKAIAQKRHALMAKYGARLEAEIDTGTKNGLMDTVVYFMQNHADPNPRRDFTEARKLYTANQDVRIFCDISLSEIDCISF